MSNWQLYAAVTSSAVAMTAGTSAAANAAPDLQDQPSASARLATQHFAASRNTPLFQAVRAAVAQPTGDLTAATQIGPPVVSPGGVVPVFGTTNTIQPGELISIYGSNLAAGIANWNQDFPTSLGGTSVEIDGRPAYLIYVSPTQINLQAPDDSATGSVAVTVTTAAGTATSSVTLSKFAPSFTLLANTKYVNGIILTPNGSGAYGNGTYNILGPTGKTLGYPTIAAAEGDKIELYCVGLGPTAPAVPAGQPYSGAAPIQSGIGLYINNILIQTTFAGITTAGLYQIDFTVPKGLGAGELPIQISVGGMEAQAGVLFSTRENSGGGFASTNNGGGSGPGGTYFSSGGWGSGGSGGGGSGSFRKRRKPIQPKLHFPTVP